MQGGRPDDARSALDANTNPESLKDLTMFGVGFTLKFRVQDVSDMKAR